MTTVCSQINPDSENEESHEHLSAGSIVTFQRNLSQYSFSSPGPKYHQNLDCDDPVSSGKGSKPKRKRVADEEHGSGTSPCSSSEMAKLTKQLAKKPKTRKPARGYAPPERYSHLRHINDCLLENLDIVFCGINPGQKSAETGHHFAHPSNHFWKCLHLSGLTPERVHPTEDYTLPGRFSLGLTNMVDRPTAEANEIKDSEMTSGIPTFFQKISRYRPRIVAYVGLHTGRLVHNYVLKNAPLQLSSGVTTDRLSSLVRKDNGRKAFGPGLQCYKIVYTEHELGGQDYIAETFFYAIPCTSGRVQGYQIPDKVAFFAQLKTDLKNIKHAE
ncbi:DNA glycosylase [Marasmius fiardii PR-910]|nr:DNA glycosylase [Marasmius fiardii PR-910]